MTPHQRDLLMRLIAVYTSMMATDLASERTAKLQQAGVENIAFAWAGEVERASHTTIVSRGPRSSSSTTTAERREPRALGLARLRWRLRS